MEKLHLKWLKSEGIKDKLGLLVSLVLLVVIFTVLSPAFLTFSNISNLI